MISKDEITEIFCLADDFCNIFDKLTKNFQSIRPILQKGDITVTAE